MGKHRYHRSPREHKRTIKSGKRITVNRGVDYNDSKGKGKFNRKKKSFKDYRRDNRNDSGLKIDYYKVKSMGIGEKIDIEENIYIKRGYIPELEWAYHEKGYRSETVTKFPNAKTLTDFVNGKIKGVKFEPPEITGKVIPIVDLEDTDYKGPDMRWTEQMTNRGKTKRVTYAYHHSDKPIKAFGKKLTAFFTGDHSYEYTSNGYRITVPKGTYVERYNSEVRINLEDYPDLKIEELKSGWSRFKIISINSSA